MNFRDVKIRKAEVVSVDKGLSGYDVPRMIVQRPEPLISEKGTLLCASFNSEPLSQDVVV